MSGPRAVPSRFGGVKVKLVIALVVLVAGAGGFLLLRSGGGSKPEAQLDLVAAETRTFDVSVTATGELRAKNQTVLRSELEKESAIVEIVEEGRRVAKGDVIVRLNGDEIQSQLDDELLQQETARADVISAESALAIQESENKSSADKAKLELELAELDLKKWEQGDVVEKRLELDTAIEKGVREHERLKTKLERSEKLFAREFLSSDELEKDRVEFIEAESALRTARVAKEVYEEYTFLQEQKKYTGAVEEKRAELERVVRRNESELASKKADLTNKRRQLELREARVTKLKGELAKSEIKAPTDGLVVYATSLEQFGWMNNNEPLNVGSVIHPNQEIVMLPDTSSMVATVKVQEAMVGRVSPGQHATVTIDAAQGKQFSGKVESIGIMAQSGGWRDPNVREYEVRIDLDITDGAHGLKPSMRAEAKIVLNEVKDVLAVPVQAVFSEGPNQFVYTASGSRFKQIPVQVGRRSDVYAEIRSGIENGQMVLLREPATGQIIKAVFETPAPNARGRGGRPGGPRDGPSTASARSAGAPAAATKAGEAVPAATHATETPKDESKDGAAESSDENEVAEADGGEAEPGESSESEQASETADGKPAGEG